MAAFGNGENQTGVNLGLIECVVDKVRSRVKKKEEK